MNTKVFVIARRRIRRRSNLIVAINTIILEQYLINDKIASVVGTLPRNDTYRLKNFLAVLVV